MMLRPREKLFPYAMFCLLGGLFAFSVAALDRQKNSVVSDEMLVALPRFVQVLMAGGDRYLAANASAIRALVADTEKLDPPRFAILGRVQSDVAWLNPAHEDNYYTAAAVLPWNGQLPASEYILYQAALARPFDPSPAFHYGFLQFYFHKNPVLGADWLRFAATRTTDELERLQFEELASRWYSRGPSPASAIDVLTDMARSTRHSGFKRYLEKRISRLRNLQLLGQAAVAFRGAKGKPPQQLEDLVNSGLIRAVPMDPFGVGYGLDTEGNPYILQPRQIAK